MSVTFSIIVPFKNLADSFVSETIPAILSQSFSDFEIILVPDKTLDTSFPKTRCVPSWPKLGPADKKDIAARAAKGKYLAFIDDDVYPDRNWLENALPYFSDTQVAAACGPGLTPPNDSTLSKVSGWMWASELGAGGAGTYRSWPGDKREVDDYPTFNLFVRKSDFLKVGGFDSGFWPGEDTKLCHDLVYGLGKKIQYDPSIVVYHHRRVIFGPHLKQIGRYGKHRGYFVRALPKTSKRIGYFIPALFSLGVCVTPFVIFLLYLFRFVTLSTLIATSYCLILALYLLGLIYTSFWVYNKSRSVTESILVMPTIFVSHMYYGFMFLSGLLKGSLTSKYTRDKV